MPKQPGKHERDPMSGEVERLLRQLRPGGRDPTSPGLVSGAPFPRPGTVPASPAGALPRNGLGTGPTPRSPGRRPSARATPAARAAAGPPTALGVWGRVILGAILAGALTQWPYRTCGTALTAYLGAAFMVLVAGVWAARAAWRARTGFAHVVAILLLFVAVGLGARQLLPRAGYAPVPAPWGCFP